LQNATRALHVDLARHLDGGVIAVVAAGQRPAERVGVLVGSGAAHASVRARARTRAHLFLHRLRQPLPAASARVACAPPRSTVAAGIAVAQRALCVPHGLAGAAELVQFVALLALLIALARLREAALAHLVEQLLELVAQRLLVLPQLAELI